jgi:putative membrane protein
VKGFIAAVLLLLLLGLTETLSARAAAAPEASPVPEMPSAPARDRTQNRGPQSDTTLKPAYAGADASFFKDGAAAGLAEVAAGRLAEQQAADARVRQFGQQMVKDHTQANAQLQALAKQKGVTLPTAPDATHQKALQDLQGLQGAAFDKAYVKAQVQDHKDAVTLFEKAAQSSDPDVSAFARKVLPTLHHHLDMIEGLARG